jgi:hypothetical protein
MKREWWAASAGAASAGAGCLLLVTEGNRSHVERVIEPLRPLLKRENAELRRANERLWTAATARSSPVLTNRDDQPVAVPRPAPPGRKITKSGCRTNGTYLI